MMAKSSSMQDMMRVRGYHHVKSMIWVNSLLLLWTAVHRRRIDMRTTLLHSQYFVPDKKGNIYTDPKVNSPVRARACFRPRPCLIYSTMGIIRMEISKAMFVVAMLMKLALAAEMFPNPIP